MATFSIYQDQENNSSILPNKLKDAGPSQKRSVLRDVNKISEDGNEAKLPVHKDLPSKKSVVNNKGKDEKVNVFGGKQYINGKVINQKLKTTKSVFQSTQNVEKGFKIYQENVELPQRGMCNERISTKDSNKNQVLKDKYVELEHASEKEISFPTSVTALHREPSLSSSSSCMSVQEHCFETDFVTQDMPMSIDSLKTDSSLKSEFAAKANELTLNEQLYGCDEYRSEISSYLRVLQHEHRPNKNYMRKQPDITHGMRAILVDWLVEVVEEYGMKTETLYLAVNYIDRFLSWMRVVRAKLQLVGTAGMFIASKFEEIYPPNVNDFVFITDDTYTKKQVLRMEHLILKVLSFDLSTPTILCFLTDFTANYPTPEKVKFLAMAKHGCHEFDSYLPYMYTLCSIVSLVNRSLLTATIGAAAFGLTFLEVSNGARGQYLCELTLLEADPYLAFLPSEIAASAFIVARYTLQDEVDEDVFPEKLQRTVDHHIEDLIDCIFALDNTFRKTSSIPQKAIQEKYKSNKYQNVASIEPLEEDCSAYLVRKYSLSLLKGIKKLNNCSETRTH